jgi:hypothetical protein
MIRTPLDDDWDGDSDFALVPTEPVLSLREPPPLKTTCMICGLAMTAYWHFVSPGHWMRSSVHDRCAARYDGEAIGLEKAPKREIPPRFEEFEPTKANQDALDAAIAFLDQDRYKCLMIGGAPARGKSRMMWKVVQSFFGSMEATTGYQAWVDYYLYTDLVSEIDKTLLSKAKATRYVFIDDIGSTQSFGRERAALQDVIRTRVAKGQWTFLTIDSLDFDPGLEEFLEGRAVKVWIRE